MFFPSRSCHSEERVDDIPLLARHFVELSVKELRCPKPRLTRVGVSKLQSYDWPGNVRELRNVIERAVIISRGGVLDFDLPVAAPTLTLPHPTARQKSDSEPEFLTEPELQRRERENLLVILQKTNWKIKGADGAAEPPWREAHYFGQPDAKNGAKTAELTRVPKPAQLWRTW